MHFESEFVRPDGSPDMARYEWWYTMVQPKMALFADETRWASVPQASGSEHDAQDVEWRKTQHFPVHPLVCRQEADSLLSDSPLTEVRSPGVDRHLQRSPGASTRSLDQPERYRLAILPTIFSADKGVELA